LNATRGPIYTPDDLVGVEADANGDRTGVLTAGTAKSEQFLSLAHALLVVLCLAAGYLAHFNSRPVSTALALVFGVVLVAARHGLRAGILAGIAVSISYNLVFSDPFLRFGLRSIDDLVPLMAFNLSAVASAYLAGRLRDEARRSRHAHERVDALLSFSQDLQKAVDATDMLHVARRSGGIDAIELHLDDARVVAPDGQADLSLVANHFRQNGPGTIPASKKRLYMAQRFSRGLLLVLAREQVSSDLPARLAILAIAAERWLLTESLVATNVLRRSEDFKTTLLSSVSHDLRTPLAIIGASAGSLLRYPEKLCEEARHELLITIEQQATRLNRLTDNLLSLVKIEGGLDRNAMPTMDVLDALGSALVAARQFAPERQITKELKLGEAIVRADPSLLEQVLINVVQNALVHTPPDTPIHIEVAAATHQVTIAVEDGGVGISDDDRELIFERFHQARVSGRRHAGSGLGLSIARGFARAAGGDVTVGRRPDGAAGARFEITLPLAAPERP
jgi:two-component system sensor histidine kinase KdpD